MSRTRDHYPRFDTTVCPDPDGCDRLYHGRLEYGDSCECCGHLIGAPAEAAPPAPAPGRCPGAGKAPVTQPISRIWAPWGRATGECRACHSTQRVTQAGVIAQHPRTPGQGPLMSRAENTNQPDAEARADGYVECSECGHPIERHDLNGCQGCPGCTCRVRWTVKAIMAARRHVGLPGRWDRSTI